MIYSTPPGLSISFDGILNPPEGTAYFDAQLGSLPDLDYFVMEIWWRSKLCKKRVAGFRPRRNRCVFVRKV